MDTLGRCGKLLIHNELQQKAEMYAQKREKVRKHIMQRRFGLRTLTSAYIYNPHPIYYSPFFSSGADLNCDGYTTFPIVKH